MDDINLQNIEKALVQIHDETPDNVCGLTFGCKTVGGQLQLQPSVIFYVQEKKAIDQVPEEERIPATVEIDGVTYVTDVVEIPPGSVVAFSACHNTSDQNNEEIARLQGFPEALVPMRGGQEITMFPDGADRYGSLSLGTLGFFAIDNEDERVVGVTNTHVVVHNVLYAKDVSRPVANELLDVKNVVEPRTWAFDGKKYPASAVIRSGGVAFYPAALHVKRYVPLHSSAQILLDSTLENKVDAALLIMNNAKFGATDKPFVDVDSFTIHRPTDVEAALQDTPYYPFATTSELDALAGTLSGGPIYAYITGRTTGPKGYCPTEKIAITGFSAITPDIAYGDADAPVTAKFKNTLVVEPAPNSAPATVVGDGGDSGSAVIAQVVDGVTGDPTMKIVGILFAGQSTRKKIWACRIDNVAAALNIRGWDSSYNFSPETSLSIPTQKLISRDLTPDGDQLYVVPDETTEIKYWNAGCTLQNYPAHFEENTTTIHLTNDSLYENNTIGQVIGQLSVIRTSNNNVVIDAYNYTLVSGDGDDDNASFSIFANQLSANEVFNYETKTTYSIRVRATNSGGVSIDRIFDIEIRNIEELAPTNITLTPATISAGVAGRLIGTLAAVSPSPTDTFDYYLVNGAGSTNNNLFAIVGASLFTAAVFTYDSQQSSNNQFSIRVQARNKYDLTYEKALTVTVTQ